MWTTAYLFPLIIVASASALCADNSTCSPVEPSLPSPRDPRDPRPAHAEPAPPTSSPEPAIDNEQGTQCCGKLFEEIKNTHIPEDEKTEQSQEHEDDDITARSRRSQSGFVRFLKNIFANPSNRSDNQDIQNKNKESSDVRTSPYNIATDEANREIRDVEKNRGTDYILYKLNETLEKLVKALSLMAQHNQQEFSIVEIPLLLQRSKREVEPNVSVIKLSNATYADVTEDAAKAKSNDSNKVHNKTKARDDEVHKHDTDSVGNVTRRVSVNVTKSNSVDLNKQANNSVENVTESQRVDNVTEYQETRNNVVHIFRTNNITDNITDNVTDKKNLTDSRETSNTDKHRSDLLIKSALNHIHKQIIDIKSIEVVSEASFKMGYIVSSLETLELTLKKIMKKMTTYRDAEWTQKITDKIELSKQVVSDLMNYLRLHTNLLTGNKKV